MTARKNFKRLVRARIAKTGESYTTALRYIRAQNPREREMKNEVGRLLKNRFVLEEKLGGDGMGEVYKALDLRQNEAQIENPYVAIKLLDTKFTEQKDLFR